MQEAFDIPKKQRESDIHQYATLDDLKLSLEVAKRVLGHIQRLCRRNCLLKPGSTDNAKLRGPSAYGSLSSHLFEFHAFGFADEVPDKSGRDGGGDGVEPVGAGQADPGGGEHDRERHGDREVGDPLGEA